MTARYDIFKKTLENNFEWVEAAQDIVAAKKRLISLTTSTPSEYRVWDSTEQKIYKSFGGLRLDDGVAFSQRRKWRLKFLAAKHTCLRLDYDRERNTADPGRSTKARRNQLSPSLQRYFRSIANPSIRKRQYLRLREVRFVEETYDIQKAPNECGWL